MRAPSTKPPSNPAAPEPRWGPIIAVSVMIVVLESLPGRLRLLPNWAVYVATALLLVPLLGVQLSRANDAWKRAETIDIFAIELLAGVLNIFALLQLIRLILYHSQDIEPIKLLASGTAVWTINVFIFTFLYWELDGGGPEKRLAGVRRPDFLFAQSNATNDVGSDWHPSFVDYLFLAFTTATAFSPTDTLPLTARAKILMMIQSGISLIAIAIVAARAVNILR
jgi:hypothetical protein